MIVRLFLSVLLLTLSGVCSWAADHRIVVTPMVNASGSSEWDALGIGFSDLLSSHLSAYDSLDVVYREDLFPLLQELELSQTGIVAKDALQIGSMVQANNMIRGSFVFVGGELTASVHLYDVQTTQLLHSFRQQGAIEGLDQIVDGLAQRIANKLSGSTAKHLQVCLLYTSDAADE